MVPTIAAVVNASAAYVRFLVADDCGSGIAGNLNELMLSTLELCTVLHSL